MSMYEMMHKRNPATYLILPMLGIHPDQWPRFRDCFVQERNFQMSETQLGTLPMMLPVSEEAKPDGYIYVLTRSGGNNRSEYGFDIDLLRLHDDYESDADDPFDNTYMLFKFRVPARWKADFDLLTSGRTIEEVSQEYREQIGRMYNVADLMQKKEQSNVG